MNRLASVFNLLMTVFVVLAFPVIIHAGLDVEKEASCVIPTGVCDDVDNNTCTGGLIGQACAADSDCDVPVVLSSIPVNTLITCTYEITVTVGTGQMVDDIVVTDKVSSDLEVDETTFDASTGTATEEPRKGRKNKGATPIEWNVGDVDATSGEVSETLSFEASTNIDPGGSQRYTFCGPVDLNSGPTAKGREDGHQVSADGDAVMGTVVNANDPNDSDQDCVADNEDNCPADFNPDQADEDNDGLGDACDPCLGDETNSCV